MFVQKVLHVVIVAVISFHSRPSGKTMLDKTTRTQKCLSIKFHDSDICPLRNASLSQELKTKGAFHK